MSAMQEVWTHPNLAQLASSKQTRTHNHATNAQQGSTAHGLEQSLRSHALRDTDASKDHPSQLCALMVNSVRVPPLSVNKSLLHARPAITASRATRIHALEDTTVYQEQAAPLKMTEHTDMSAEQVTTAQLVASKLPASVLTVEEELPMEASVPTNLSRVPSPSLTASTVALENSVQMMLCQLSTTTTAWQAMSVVDRRPSATLASTALKEPTPCSVAQTATMHQLKVRQYALNVPPEATVQCKPPQGRSIQFHALKASTA